jgi:Flp pilus assembly protein TadB
VGLGLFIIATQEAMGHALLYTFIGHGVLIAIAVLEIVGFVWVRKILQVDV